MSLFGNWKLKTSTKFDEYMKEVGVNWALRKAGAACSSTTEITQEGDGLRLNTQSTVRSTNCVFPIGKEIDYKTMDGRNVKSTLEFDNNVAKVTEKWDGKTSTITYAVRNDQMVITCEMNGVVCERFHDKA